MQSILFGQHCTLKYISIVTINYFFIEFFKYLQKAALNSNDAIKATNQNVNGPGQTSNQSTGINMDQSNYQHRQQPAWKALSDFALQSKIEKPPFQQLVSTCLKIF